MTYNEIRQHYGRIELARAALGYKSRQALYLWKKTGIPEAQQFRIEVLTGGNLKAERPKPHK